MKCFIDNLRSDCAEGCDEHDMGRKPFGGRAECAGFCNRDMPYDFEADMEKCAANYETDMHAAKDCDTLVAACQSWRPNNEKMVRADAAYACALLGWFNNM